jgi:hypothetical protein
MKSSSLRIIVGVTAILAFTVACSMPFVISPVQPVEKIVYVEITSTPVVVATAAPSPTANFAVPAATPTVSVNLDGAWTIWQGIKEQQLDIDFLQQGYTLIGNTATNDGQSLLFNGTISQDGKSVSGTWESTNGTSGSFIMALDASLATFNGNLGGGVPFCGNRGSFSKPSPCIK